MTSSPAGLNHFIAQRAQVQPARAIVAGQVDVVPDPVEVDGRVDAIVLEQGHGDAGDGGGFHVRESPFQDAEATDPDNGLDLARLDQGHDDGRAFGHEHGVTELLGFGLKVLDGAEAALLAEQPELIEGGGALAFHTEAFGQEEQAPVVGDTGQAFPPHLVVEQHSQVITVDGVDLGQLQDAVRVFLELIHGQRGHGVVLSHVMAHRLEDAIPLLGRLGDVLLGRPETLLHNVSRDRDRL
jgi:hypothetical protein